MNREGKRGMGGQNLGLLQLFCFNMVCSAANGLGNKIEMFLPQLSSLIFSIGTFVMNNNY